MSDALAKIEELVGAAEPKTQADYEALDDVGTCWGCTRCGIVVWDKKTHERRAHKGNQRTMRL